jgi:hypothetical protein
VKVISAVVGDGVGERRRAAGGPQAFRTPCHDVIRRKRWLHLAFEGSHAAALARSASVFLLRRRRTSRAMCLPGRTTAGPLASCRWLHPRPGRWWPSSTRATRWCSPRSPKLILVALGSPHTGSPRSVSRQVTGLLGRVSRSRKPVCAFSPSRVRIPPLVSLPSARLPLSRRCVRRRSRRSGHRRVR